MKRLAITFCLLLAPVVAYAATFQVVGGSGGAPSIAGGESVGSFLSDSSSHAPPSSGQYDYDDWTPEAVGFPGIGETYTDPVFGGVLKRLTDTFEDDSIDDTYVRNGFWNADGTRFMWASTDGGQAIISTVDGSVVRTGAPTSIGGEPQFAPDDADKMYWISGATLKSYSLANGTSTTIKTFPATLEAVGGSVDYVSDDGRYFVVAYSSAYHVWDKQTDTIYTGAISDHAFGTGWVGITPSGSYVVVATTAGNKYSYAIDHDAHSVATTGKLFWTLNGDHADLISPSDGHDYLVTFENSSIAAVYRVDVSLTQTAGAGEAQQVSQNTMLLDIAFDDAGHLSCGGDYAWYSSTPVDDTFADQGTWRAYKAEIIRINVITGAVERYAHHRSRSAAAIYRAEPRICAYKDGTKAAFTSNMSHDNESVGYNDLYMIEAAN